MTINQARINELVQQNYITAKRHPELPLTIYNYSPKATYERFWTEETLMCRGLILADNGEVVARPFDKFFNWGQDNRQTAADIINVTEKMDGSLGILYWWQGKPYIATRGSFDSEQALWATEFLRTRYDTDGMIGDITLLFEIIYPDNRVVVDYKDKEDLVLLAVRNRFNGQYYPWSTIENIAKTFGFSLPTVYQFDSPQHILESAKALDPNAEGWVVEFTDGQRFKFKGESYVELHRLISGLSFKNTLACVVAGTVNELRAIVPDEFLGQVNGWVEEINARFATIMATVEDNYQVAPRTNRKDYALWVQTTCPHLASYMFARLDGRPIDELIYKLAFRDRVEIDKGAERVMRVIEERS